MRAHLVLLTVPVVALAAALGGCVTTGTGTMAPHLASNVTDDAASTAPVQVAMLALGPLPSFGDQQPSGAPIIASDDSDATVCRAAPPATGSRLGSHTICMTGEQWRDKTQNDRDQLTDAEQRALADKSGPF